MIVNGIVFSTSFFGVVHNWYRNESYFCVLILYLATLLNFLISSKTVSSADRDNLTSSFSLYVFDLFLAKFLWSELPVLCWIQVARVAVLALFLILVGKFSVFHCWHLLSVVNFSYMAFIMLRWFPSICSLLRFFIMKDVEFCQMLFLYQLRLSCRFFLYSINAIYYQYMTWFCYVEPFLHSKNKSHLVMMYNPFNVLLNLVESILSRIFASVFIRDTVCGFLYLQYLCWVLDFEVVLLS